MFISIVFICQALQINEGSMSGYLTLSEVYSYINELYSNYSSFVSILELGISSNLNKTVTVISASQKSGFPITTSAALYFAYNLLSTITTNYISYLLKTREIYIFPLINVDAYA